MNSSDWWLIFTTAVFTVDLHLEKSCEQNVGKWLYIVNIPQYFL